MSNTYQHIRDHEDQTEWEKHQVKHGLTPKKFERENRYLVLKRKYIDRYLNHDEQNILHILSNKIYDARIINGSRNKNHVIVEDTWPEYEAVWKMIERRVRDE